MNIVNIILNIALADFRERSRRYSYIILLSVTVYAAYWLVPSTDSSRVIIILDRYRSIYNSAYIGSLSALLLSMILSLLGFYLVKNTLTKDAKTTVGQIIGSSPISKFSYILGKALSNFLLLLSIVLITGVVTLMMFFINAENNTIDVWNFFSPYIFIVLPSIFFISCLAILFETIPPLQGGFGNIVYFFTWISGFGAIAASKTITDLSSNSIMQLLDVIGFSYFYKSMGKAVLSAFPDYTIGDFRLTTNVNISEANAFQWLGIEWTYRGIGERIFVIFLGFLLLSLGSIAFNRFDVTRIKKPKILKPFTRKNKAYDEENGKEEHILASRNNTLKLTPINKSGKSFRFFDMLISELLLSIKGLKWWWYLVSVFLIALGIGSSTATAKEFLLLPISWLWPLLIWSAMGNRETGNNTCEILFSTPYPVLRQLPYQWLSGFIITLLFCSGYGIRLLIEGFIWEFFALLAGAIFIPSLALALGVWTKNSKGFEVLYLLLWYLGPLNKISPLDFTGTSVGEAITLQPFIFIFISIVLFFVATIGRYRQIQV